MLDKELPIVVTGLDPYQYVTIQAFTYQGQVRWASRSVFQADLDGIVCLSKQAPVAGTYEGIDPMGLFWSMKMEHALPKNYEGIESKKGVIPYLLKVLDGKEEIAKKAIYRRFIAEDVKIKPIQEKFLGVLFLPPLKEPQPLVVVLGGSEGGVPWFHASMLASNGFPTLALAYHGCGGLPTLEEGVSLEYFEAVFEWIADRKDVSREVILHGTSRGGELALILAAYYPDWIDRIVAVSPSSVVLSRGSWVIDGEPILPAAPYMIDLNNMRRWSEYTREDPLRVRKHREKGIELDRESFDAAAIPVEYIECPILLVSGGDDQLGPASTYANMVVERLKIHGSNTFCKHLDYPDAGHFISLPYLIRENILFNNGTWWNFGGTPRADEWASRDSWEYILEYLRKSFQ